MLEAEPPIVVTVTNDEHNLPRIPKVRDVMMSYRQPLTQWTLDDLGIEANEARAGNTYYQVVELFIPQKETRCEFVTGDTLDQKVESFAKRIVEVTSALVSTVSFEFRVSSSVRYFSVCGVSAMQLWISDGLLQSRLTRETDETAETRNFDRSMNDVVIFSSPQPVLTKPRRDSRAPVDALPTNWAGGCAPSSSGTGADTLASELSRFCDTVLIADQAELAEYQPETCLNALVHLCGELSPRAVLLAGDTYSQEIAPRLAHRLGGSAVGDGVELRVEGEALRVSRQVYGGKAQAVIELKRMPAVVWLRARSFAPAAPRGPKRRGHSRHVGHSSGHADARS